ncbi:bifunctional DNA primase/polymerase [Crossiella sp. SN42]|uniref:bifunctional DNA primase/polymerase n=1 Tax=Crossiella sp. SN42 TaxID=2944808 RepID=UPI00207CC8DC|nr:bifunctional DNA primase/polymerase [Crossiella sp. SN42]MCO1581203.1 bifunctional DNA primase/polymerase [Crossiella sp. SN42]
MTTRASDNPATVALWMATHLGWHVLPLNPGTKKPLGGCTACRADRADHTAPHCPCLARQDGALCHGVWAASADPAVITRWARTWRSSVWGLHLGVSGLLGVDLDTRPDPAPAQPLHGLDWPADAGVPVDGLDVFAALAGMHGAAVDTAGTLCTQTPSGGLHLIYAAEAGRWKSSSVKASSLGRVCTGLGWQVDIKCYAGYVVIPGSRTTAGLYRRISATTTPAPLPAWLAERLAATGHDRHAAAPASGMAPAPALSGPAGGGSRGERFAAGALRSACAELAAMAPDSGRNRKLFREASKLAGMAAAGWIDRDQVQTALAQAAAHARLPASEIRYAIASGFRRPRPVPELETAA